jgi:hypothetical protein
MPEGPATKENVEMWRDMVKKDLKDIGVDEVEQYDEATRSRERCAGEQSSWTRKTAFRRVSLRLAPNATVTVMKHFKTSQLLQKLMQCT